VKPIDGFQLFRQAGDEALHWPGGGELGEQHIPLLERQNESGCACVMGFLLIRWLAEVSQSNVPWWGQDGTPSLPWGETPPLEGWGTVHYLNRCTGGLEDEYAVSG
jgi:hypothetical protein